MGQTNFVGKVGWLSKIPTGSERKERDRNFWIEKERDFLSLPIINFASLKVYLFLFMRVFIVSIRVYLFCPQQLPFCIHLFSINIYPWIFRILCFLCCEK